jgi:hypothetical protein
VAGYEKRDINAVKIINYSAAGVLILSIILLFLYNYFLSEKEEIVYETQLKPESVLLRELKASEEETLTSYKVLNAQEGIYQIPIERAMQLIAEEQFKKQLQSK